MPITKEKLLEAWKKEICERHADIDPNDERQWEDLFVGFAIGKGLSPEEATDYNLYIKEAFPLEA